MNAVDTNVFVYLFDADEPAKQNLANNLIGQLSPKRDQTVLLWQVASEFLNQIRRWQRLQRFDEITGQTMFHRVGTLFPLTLPTVDVLNRSFDLHSRFSLSHWDAMLLAACQEAGVTTLYSEDLQAGMDYDGVVTVNPFA